MSCCSCHTRPPCPYCELLYQCEGCGELKHPDNDGANQTTSALLCDDCLDIRDDEVCTKCDHSQGWHREGQHACLECGCLAYE